MLRYPGGKHKLKKEILSSITKFYRAKGSSLYEYREPFFGGGSIGLSLIRNYRSFPKKIWINDFDKALACLWNSIINNPQPLCDLVDSFVPTAEKFFEFKRYLSSEDFLKTTVANLFLEVGFKKLAIHQMSYSGLGTKAGGPIGGKNQKSKYDVSCRWNPAKIKKDIFRTHSLLNSREIREGGCTYFDFPSVIIDEEVPKFFLYLDPPYYEKGNELYQFAFSEEDHTRLRDRLEECKNPWLLSYDDCEEVRGLYEGFPMKTISVNYTINTSRTKRELLISNENRLVGDTEKRTVF